MEILTTFLQSLPDLAVTILKATLVLAILQLVLAAAPRLSSSARHMLLVTGLAAFLLFPLFSYVIPSWNLPLLPQAEAAATSPLDDPGITAIHDSAPNAITITGRRIGGMSPPSADSEAPVSDSGSSTGLPWGAITAYAWMTIALLLIARVGIGFLRVLWVVRTAETIPLAIAAAADDARDRIGLDREVRLLASSFVAVPMVTGFVRPTLLLPASAAEWPEDLRQVVLVHELAHLKRWDTLTLVLTQLVTALYWFHPQVWVASRAARRECERACDDLVLITGTRPSDYAGHLLSMARVMPEIESLGAATLGMSERSQLEGRLLAILQPGIRRRRIEGRAAALVAIAMTLLIAPLSAARLTTRGMEPPSTVRLASFPSDGVIEQASLQSSGSIPALAQAPVAILAQSRDADSRKKSSADRDREPRNAEEWYERGMKLHRSDRYAEAIEAFGRAASAGYRPGPATYNIACGYALQDDRDQALAWLDRAIAAGYRNFGHMRSDSDLDPVRTDPRFEALLVRHGASKSDSRKGEENRIARATARFDSLRASRSTDGERWSDVGVDLLRLRMFDESVFALERAVENLPFRASTEMYNLACAQALRGDRRAALRWLRHSIEAGFDNPEKIRRDPDLSSMRGSAEHRELIALAENLSLHAHAGDHRGTSNYSKHRWAPAAAHFENFVRAHPEIGRGWYNLGWARHHSSEFGPAIEAFDRARQLGYREPTAMYNMACGYAMLGRGDEAVTWLERSRAAGFDLHDHLWDDEDLESLHGTPRFDALAKSVDDAAHARERARKEKKKTAKLERI